MTSIEFAVTLAILVGIMELREYRIARQQAALRRRIDAMEHVLKTLENNTDKMLDQYQAAHELVAKVNTDVSSLVQDFEVRLRSHESSTPDFIGG